MLLVVSQLLVLGKSVIHNANKTQDADEDIVKFEWPMDSAIRTKTQSMTAYLEVVAISFVTVCVNWSRMWFHTWSRVKSRASTNLLLQQRWGFVPDESKMECFNGEVFVGSLQLMRAKWSFYGERKKAENNRKKGEESWK
ncbi:hypothetical protein L6452_05482 [Arctium lappa]|uniref:Uncharacterized protein n=1 Tax=Arctium lappa TaxID=4217 RepID=A0ACB9EH73_ARCLA|nr:hypothetical protein L6452_05482 [Arctium lappa]